MPMKLPPRHPNPYQLQLVNNKLCKILERLRGHRRQEGQLTVEERLAVAHEIIDREQFGSRDFVEFCEEMIGLLGQSEESWRETVISNPFMDEKGRQICFEVNQQARTVTASIKLTKGTNDEERIEAKFIPSHPDLDMIPNLLITGSPLEPFLLHSEIIGLDIAFQDR